ncbi:MAG: TraR/DksA family transcriptional regulator [Nannocystaceae bacterium]
MEHLTTEQRELLQSELQRQRESVVAERQAELARVGQRQAADVGDTQDAAAGEESRQRSTALVAKHDRLLAELDAALERFEEGTFGICEETDEPIPYGRLRVQPATRYSVAAQELLERRAADTEEDSGAY